MAFKATWLVDEARAPRTDCGWMPETEPSRERPSRLDSKVRREEGADWIDVWEAGAGIRVGGVSGWGEGE